ncbi:hypothetical protein IFM89_002108 [Coptis chinensis]|uniref:AP2/ERF domain-containing protein n=1 Tax=Coptis chinensis TaxID=261450 RepID=A0A835H3Z5_9MAGN|nr:hypothetical protein IFM89_002108 [Coptis chinensis]
MESLHDTSSTKSSSPTSELYATICSANVPAIVSHKRNAGRKKFKETRHPVYRGVRKRNGCKWVCEVREPYKKSRLWLGTHSTPEMAARAYDVAALALRGKSAPLNFADSAWLLPRPKSSSAEDIKSAAFLAAQAFRPATSSSITASSESSSPSISTTYVHLRRVKSLENPPEYTRMFWDDEEALFNLPSLLDSMAEGLLLSPPSMMKISDSDDVDWNMDFSLWSHH